MSLDNRFLEACDFIETNLVQAKNRPSATKVSSFLPDSRGSEYIEYLGMPGLK